MKSLRLILIFGLSPFFLKAQFLKFSNVEKVRYSNSLVETDSLLKTFNYKLKGTESNNKIEEGFLFYRFNNPYSKLDGVYIQGNRMPTVVTVSTSDKIYYEARNKCASDTLYFKLSEGVVDGVLKICYCNALQEVEFSQWVDEDFGTIYSIRIKNPTRKCYDKIAAK
jgi:hypothetical protein